MLLAIDIGNSNVVIGCLDADNRVVAQFRMVTDLKKTEDEYAAGMQAILLHNGIDGDGENITHIQLGAFSCQDILGVACLAGHFMSQSSRLKQRTL